MPGMMIPSESPLRARPWAWLLKAVLVGAVPSILVTLYFGGHDGRVLLLSAAIGTIFSVVIWGGHECSRGWLERHSATHSPRQAALFILAKWMLVYVVLVSAAMVLVRLLLGVNSIQDRQTAFFTFFIGLVISGQIVSVRANSRMVATARELEQARAQAGFLALKAQLSPHTLFNALNTIAALIPDDPKAAEEAVMRLSALLRRILAALEKERWSLAEEFLLIGDFLKIQYARFGQRLIFELELPESEEEREIPPLLLLPLVENSLKHGFSAKIGHCHLLVRVGAGVVSVQDDGVGRDPAAPDGVGIRTVRLRAESLGGRLDWPETMTGCIAEVHLCP
jgi:sensor histidine kinase YesM